MIIRKENEVNVLLILITYVGILLSTGQCNSFTPTAISTTPNFAKSTNSQYKFTFSAATTFSQNFQLRISYPTEFTLTQPTGCSLKINNNAVPTATCSLNTGTNEIVFSNINNAVTVGSMEVLFNTTTARYSGPFNLIISLYDVNLNSLISGEAYYVTISIINAVMTCSLSSSSAITGDNATYTLSYTPTVQVQQQSIVQIQMQPWGPYSRSNFISTNTTRICADLCTVTSPSANANLYELIKYSGLYPTSSSTARTLSMGSARNPPSVKQITFSILVSTYLSAFSQRQYMTCSGTFSVPNLNTFNSVSFPTTNKQISQNNIITLVMSLKNPISSISYLRISPSILSLSYQFNQYNMGTQPTQQATSDQTLLLGNLTQSSSTSAPSLLLLNNFTLSNPPYGSKPVTMTFRTENLIDGVYYGIQTGTVQIVANISTITVSGVTPTLTSINAVTNYTVWFRLVNKLITGSFIRVVFPSQILLTAPGSTCTLIGLPSTCTIISSSTLQIQTNNIPAATNVSINISSVKNPPTTTASQSLQISTFYEDEASVVDRLTSGLIVTATQVPLGGVSISSTSMRVGINSNYTLTIQISNQLPASSSVKVKLPISSFPSSNLVLLQLSVIKAPSSTTTVYSSCSIVTISPLYIQLPTTCFSQTLLASSSIIIVLGNITNPLSTKPTQSVQIQTFYNGKLMEYLRTGITIQMTSTAAINNYVVTPTNTIVNQQNTYSFQVVFQYSHYSGDRVIIGFPQGVLLGAGFFCSPVTTNIDIFCNKPNQQTLQVTFTTSSGSPSTTYTSLRFNTTTITNNWYSGTRTFTIQTTTNSTTYYYVQNGQAVVNFGASTLPATALSNEKIIVLGTSKIELSLSSPFVLSRVPNTSLLKMTIIVPNDLTPILNTCQSSYSSSVCSLSSQTYTLTAFDNFPSVITFTFNATATFFAETSPFTIRLLYNNIAVASNTQLKVLRYCTVPCKQCTATQNQCLTCLPQPQSANNTLLPTNSTCVVTCPSTFFLNPDSQQCAQCNTTACLQCQTSANICTACVTNKYLYQAQCRSVCPDNFYPFNGQCLGCNSPCLKCSSATFCLNCVTNYFLDVDNKCVLTCTQTGYLGIAGICQKCTNNCVTCQGTLSNCTACDSPTYLLLGNQCVRACSPGFYNNVNSTCLACVSPCSTCRSATICQSCISNYFLFDNTTCTQTCPSGTLPVINVCQRCSSQCASCSGTLSNCTSCPSSLLYYLNQCLTQCPALTYPYQKTCTTCITPCVTCSQSPEVCLSCIGEMYLLNNTCLNACPTNSYYTDNQTKQCLPCINNCIQCQSTVNCISCQSSYYLFDGSCVQQCPQSKPIVENRQCFGCSKQCATCQGTPTNCTQCTVFYFRYEYTCVQICPITYYSNIVNYQCEDGLSSKIVFFPILITSAVVITIILISKCIAPVTALPTAIAALMSPLQLAIWIFLAVLLGAQIKQPDVDYVLPIVMVAITLVCFFTSAIVFFILNKRRVEQDEYFKQWASNSINYYVMRSISLASLIVGCRFYRLVYSRMFNSLALSSAFKNRSNIFTIATVFTILFLLLCQVPMCIACWSLVYSKVLKDQLFYTAIQCLIITVIAALISLVDIYKSEEFFEETQFFKLKKYVEKVKDSSFNKLEEGFDIGQDQGSVDAEKYVGVTGGKFMYSKQNPNNFDSLKQLYFEDENNEDNSQDTDFNQTSADKFKKNKKGKNMINIFAAIKQQDAEYYQQQKYQQQQANTQLQLEKQEKKKKLKTHQSDEDNDIDGKQERKMELGNDQFDDKKSLISERSRKKRWNNILLKRKQLADKIFNKHPINLDKIEDEKQEDDQGDMEYMQLQFNSTQKRRRRRKKKGQHNKQLEEIYLQRLTERKKKSTRDFFNSDKSLKYDF